MGREIVGQVREELAETGSRLWDTTDMAEIFDRMSNDPALRYQSRAGDARACPACRRRRRGGGTQVVRRRARRAVHGRAGARGRGGRHGAPPTTCRERSTARARGPTSSTRPSPRSGTATPPRTSPSTRPCRDITSSSPSRWSPRTCPPARRVLYDTACAEGWGLYSERLADEMGLYSDDLARMGLFAADSWRASRLVVDTGLHAMGWTRQQAVDWMVEHTPTAPHRDRVRGRPLHLVPRPGARLHGRPAGDRPAPRHGGRTPSARASTSGSSTTSCCGPGYSRFPRWRGPSSAGWTASAP